MTVCSEKLHRSQEDRLRELRLPPTHDTARPQSGKQVRKSGNHRADRHCQVVHDHLQLSSNAGAVLSRLLGFLE